MCIGNYLLLLLVGASNFACAEFCKNSDEVVLSEVSRILKIEIRDLKTELPFSEQSPPGDVLDIVESVLAVEESLNISINDQDLDKRIGSTGVHDLAQKLTIRTLQQVAKEQCIKR